MDVPLNVVLLIALLLAVGVIVWLVFGRRRPSSRVAAFAAASSEGWSRSESGRFHYMTMPRSTEAERLGSTEFFFYGEFDTTLEPDAWKAYLYDPLRVLRAEGVPLPSHRLHITMVKLHGDGQDPSEEYVAMVQQRDEVTKRLIDSHGAPERDIVITTTIVGHENGLNPRVVQTYA
ncbi:MAG TPA: hypothetical protein VFY15_01590 [Acidimicrobiia bacterium]|nr:hypothetical protein [Acidimicrobiia bacterium]